MQNDWFLIESPSRELIELLGRTPGVKWTWRNGRVTHAQLHRTHLPLIPRSMESEWHAIHQAEPFALHSAMVWPVDGNFALRDYQARDLPFVLNRRASILGYEMRLGKTALASCAHRGGPLLIVGPLIARDVWREWIERVHGFAPVALESKHDVPLPGFPAYFIHFDILDAHSGFLQQLNPATLIIDEIHLLQARRSQRMSAISLVASRAQRIIGLSGTPMWSNPKSLWPILNLLSPGAWGSEFDFCLRYTNAHKGAYGWTYEGTNNEEELKARLSELIVRRTWKDVAPKLPPTTNIVEAVEIVPSKRTQLDMLAEKSRLANIAVGKQPTVAGHLARLRKLYGELKIKRAVELATQAMADGHKVVLWTWHTEVASKLMTALPDTEDGCVWTIRAEDSQDLRAMRIRTFQECAYPCAFVVPLAVGGVAIDLSSADVAIFVELDWIPGTIYQASMRTFSPKRPSSNIFLFADTPVERRLVEVLGCNEACASALNLGYEEVSSKVLDSGISSSEF